MEGSSSSDPEAEASGKARGLSRKSTREAPSNLIGGRKIRCAIYTRKSSEEGLEQEFNSLDAQREACEAYIKSQRHEGWSVQPHLYDDAGYSGGTMERPALKRLLADIAAHRIDAVVLTGAQLNNTRLVEARPGNIIDIGSRRVQIEAHA
jgi:Resolvase, N terminal domain